MVAKWAQNGRKLDALVLKFAVILHRILKFNTMQPLSIIAIGAAFANYRKAKAAYLAAKEADQATIDALNLRDSYLRMPEAEEKERAEAKQAFVDDYYSQMIEQLEADERDATGKPQSIEVTPVVRIGNLEGKYCKCGISLVFKNISETNTYRISGVGDPSDEDLTSLIITANSQNSNNNSNNSNNSYKVTGLKADANVFGTFLRGSVVESDVDFILEPLSYKEISFKKTICEMDKDTLAQLKADICAALGKKLFSSCYALKVSLAGAASVDVEFVYGSGKTYAGLTPATIPNQIGVLRYVGEAY